MIINVDAGLKPLTISHADVLSLRPVGLRVNVVLALNGRIDIPVPFRKGNGIRLNKLFGIH